MANFETIPSTIANGDFSTSQFCAVKMTTGADFEVGICTAATDFPVGILQNNPDTCGQGAQVAFHGIAKAQLGGTVNRNERLTASTGGKLISIAQDGTTGSTILGRSLQSGSSGERIYVLLAMGEILGGT